MKISQIDRPLLLDYIRKNAPLLQGKILDVGGQDGKRYREFFAHAADFTVLDPDASAHPDIVAGAEKIPLGDASVDGILCCEVLMYIKEIQQAVDEMARVLKPGGVLMATVSFMATPAHRDGYYWQFAPDGLRHLLSKDFKDVRIERRGGFRCQQLQNRERHLILKYNLYTHRVIGRLFSGVFHVLGLRAKRLDARDASEATQAFAMGFCLTAVRA